MEEIEKQLKEIAGSIKILDQWLDKEKLEKITQDLINEFFNHHRDLYARNLNRKIKEMLGI